MKTIGNSTDIFLLKAQAKVEEKDGYLRIETPDNHGYFWGNFLFFPAAPKLDDFEKWTALFRHEFRLQPEVRHMTFGWDSEERGATEAFQKDGFHLDSTSVLILEEKEIQRPERMHSSLEVRALHSEEDWEAMIENQINCRLESFKRDVYEPFKRRQVAAYRKLASSGAGHWYGGFLGNELVADCGLFFTGPKLGRFQAVGTAPAHRKKGICAALVHAVCLESFKQQPKARLVMAAAAEEPAERVYKSVGFLPRERQFGLCKWPKEIWVK